MGQWQTVFSYADFEGVLLKVVQYEGEENNSLSRFTDQLLAHLNLKDRDPFVRIDQFNITDGSYKKVDLNKKIEILEVQIIIVHLMPDLLADLHVY